MNRQTKALVISLVVHSGLIYLVFTISCSFSRPEKPVLIDFTLMDSRGPDSKGSESSGTEKTAKQSPPAPARSKVTEPKKIEASEKPHIANILPSHPQPVPVMATEPTGKVAVSPTPSNPPASVSTVVAENGPPGNISGKMGQETGSGHSGPGSGTGQGRGQGEATSGNGKGPSSDQMRTRYLKEQFEYIRGLIQKNLAYPVRARRMGWEGRTVVSFTILENGRVQDIKILNSSGYDLLDDNVLETITKVEPFPKPPVKAELKIPITYRLH
jgi:protein TonB